MTDSSSGSNTKDSLQTPGQVLRFHREKQNLSQQDIAKRIHLDINVIESIEQDNNKDMPAATYVKGYLRSYAKIVDADADHVISLYNSDSPQQPPEILPEVKPPTQVSSSDKPVKAFTYLITLGLVILLLIWYQSNFVVDNASFNEPENYNTPEIINGVDVTFDIVQHPETWESPSNTSEANITNPDTTETNPTAIENDVLELQADNGEESLGIISIDGIEDNVAIDKIGSGPDLIEMTLSRDSWIEINDATDKRLFHDLALDGEKYAIRGTAPFNLLFGFSPAVTIKFNGKSFDHSRFSNNGIARFKLPE